MIKRRRSSSTTLSRDVVNEMLTQMESFQSVFVASTNLMNGLDQVILRHFDLRVQFDYFQTDQARELYIRYCAELAMPVPLREVLTQLAGLKKLTPGDFATVVRQNWLRTIRSSENLFSVLDAECAAKEGARAIGFVQ